MPNCHRGQYRQVATILNPTLLGKTPDVYLFRHLGD
jgi:hypothetical protein